jgi:ankyrin repeat protein
MPSAFFTKKVKPGGTGFSLSIAALALSAIALNAAPLPLIEAAKSTDRAALKSLLDKKTDPNTPDADGTTALHWASYRDDLESVDALLRAGAKVNAKNDLGATPLWTAAQNGSAPMVKRLLAAGADPNLTLLSGESPLMVAARSGSTESVEALLAKGANINQHGTRGQTALMWAVAQKHPDVVKVLLAHKADLNLKSDAWNEVMAVPPHGYRPYNMAVPHGGETALMFAARVGDLESAKLLVDAGADVNDQDAWGVSALVLATHSGFHELSEYLLSKKADPNRVDAGFSALHEAIMRRDESLVASLLDHGADANFPVKTWTPTRRSSDDFHFDPSLVGASPYWLAARFLQTNVMKMLLEHGADPKFVHHANWVAEQGFGQSPRSEVVSPVGAAVGMLRAKPWIDVAAKERPALMLEAVKIAVEAGGDMNLPDTDGRTPLDAAKTAKNAAVVTYLTEKGAKPGKGGGGVGATDREAF